MKAKKLICIILCFVLAFTLLSGPWRAEAEAAGLGAIVLAIVGTCIVSAGFSFATKGEFQAATDAFMKSDGAKFATWLNDFALTAGNGILDFATLIATKDFRPFMMAIYEFFSKGNVEVETSAPDFSSELVYYNGVELPVLPVSPRGYDNIVIIRNASGASLNPNCYSVGFFSNPLYINDSGTFINSNGYVSYDYYYFDGVSWSGFKQYNSINYSLPLTSDSTVSNRTFVVWSNKDLLYKSGGIYLEMTDFVYPEQSFTDTIPVSQDPTYTINDIIEGWSRRAEEGSIEWELDSLTVFEDVTSPDKTAPMESTQAGVLTQAGVKVESIAQTMEDYKTPTLASVFPFCIPFDIYNFLSILTAEREAPHFDFNLDFGGLGSHEISVDLSGWETVATILRTIELLGFCIGLAFATSKVIKW